MTVQQHPLLAEEYLYCAHDTISGRRLLSDRMTGLGLGGARLGELVLASAMRIVDGRLEVTASRSAGLGDADVLLREIAAERDLTAVRDWLQYLATDSYEVVGDRMVEAGLVEHRRTRRLWRRVDLYVPKDMNVAEWPVARLATIMRRREPMERADAALAGILGATGVATSLFVELDLEPLQYAMGELRRRRDVVGDSLLELLAQTEAVVGDAVLTYRT